MQAGWSESDPCSSGCGFGSFLSLPLSCTLWRCSQDALWLPQPCGPSVHLKQLGPKVSLGWRGEDAG